MKKITSLLMLLMLFCGMGWAQQVAAPKNGVYKIYWEYNKRGYLTYAFGSTVPIEQNEPQLADVTLAGCADKHFNSTTHKDIIDLNWYVYTAKSGNTYIFTVRDGKFVGIGNQAADAGKSSTLTMTPQAMKIYAHSVGNGHVYAQAEGRLLGSGCGAEKGNGHPVRWNNQNQMTDGGTPFKFIQVTDVTIKPEVLNKAVDAIAKVEPVKLNFTDSNSGIQFVEWKKLQNGSIKEQINLPYYAIDTCNPENYELGVTESVDVTVKSEFPFATTTIVDGNFADGTQWYTLNIANGNRDVVYDGSSKIFTKQSTRRLDKNSLWAFVKESGNSHGFKVYNFAAGALKPLGVKNFGEKAVLDEVTGANATNSFKLTKNNHGFVLQHPTNANNNLGAHGNNDGANTALGFWNNSNSAGDKGSAFRIQSVDDYIVTQYPIVWGNSSSLPEENTYVGTFESFNNFFSEKVGAYLTDRNNDALSYILENVAKVDFTGKREVLSPNKFYQLISYNDANCKGQIIYAKPWCDRDGEHKNDVFGDRWLKIGNNTSAAETALIFVASGNNYKIQHANSKYWMARPSAFGDMGAMDLPVNDDGHIFVLHNERGFSNVWSLRGDNANNKFLHCGTGNGQIISRHQSPSDNAGDLWVIKEITSVPVTIGKAKWSTLCLPMPVTIPTDKKDLHVYRVSSIENGFMKLTEIPAGTTLAKETPVLLQSTSTNESDTYTFTVCDANVEATSFGPTENYLSGTTARRSGFNEGNNKVDYYALGNKKYGVGFYPATSNTIPANKAYYLKPAGTNAAALRFSFDDLTGIDTPVQSNQKVKYYDMSGKRVFYPSNGIFITSDGKKVFIK